MELKPAKPAEDNNAQAKDAMDRAVGKITEQKKHEPIGTEEAERKVAQDLKRAAEQNSNGIQRDVDKNVGD
jgi:hypothetical protein